MRAIVLAFGVLAVSACATERSPASDSAGATTSAAGAVSDPNHPTAGGGVPVGYVGRTDAGEPIAQVQYTREDDKWRVATGPAHIAYQLGDTASGTYTAATRLHVMNARADHPEAFGLFIGGRNLDTDAQQYTYFLVRGLGEYLVAHRNGANRTLVKNWTAHPAIPKADSTGKAPDYHLAVRVGADSVRFIVNEQQVAAVPKSAVSTDGNYGVRVNHNLQLHVWPVTVSR